ncbi:hypothetical protein ACFPM3_14175 [Streptomyces coeruleoprunus]|uniref:VOC domain-containing protein n=1 Tax=Streptomyces coeruleoprunus TaxID=285563 RepID=A0ABV9XF18_9ACTN
MAVRDIAYVEVYTSRKQSVADYFVSTMGFSRTADSVAVDRSSVLLRQGDAHLVVTTGPATWKFLAAQGDGIADVALTCDDVDETRAAAAAAGAAVTGTPYGGPVVAGAGSVVHSLLPHTPGTDLPPGRTWVPAQEAEDASGPGGAPAASHPSDAGAGDGRGVPAAADGPPRRVQGLDHVALCVPDGMLGTYTALYRDAFGLTGGTHTGSARTALLRSPAGRAALALDPDGPPGAQHLALRVAGGAPVVCGLRRHSLRLYGRSHYGRTTLFPHHRLAAE